MFSSGILAIDSFLEPQEATGGTAVLPLLHFNFSVPEVSPLTALTFMMETLYSLFNIVP